MSKIIIGRYIPGDSIIYKMDSRGKILSSFLFIILIFFANNFISYTIVALFTLLAVLATGLNLKIFWNGVKPLVGLVLVTSFLQLFFTNGGKIYWQWGILSLSSFGIQNAIFIFLRFVLIILMSTVLTLTTMPLEIANAMEWILAPLKIIRIPVAEIALIMSIALRFVPTLMDETVKIMNAQRARGMDFNARGLVKKVKAIIPIFVPLFINSLMIASDLATAMESRGYQENAPRTRYRLLKWSKYDLTNLIYFISLAMLLMIFRTY